MSIKILTPPQFCRFDTCAVRCRIGNTSTGEALRPSREVAIRYSRFAFISAAKLGRGDDFYSRDWEMETLALLKNLSDSAGDIVNGHQNRSEQEADAKAQSYNHNRLNQFNQGIDGRFRLAFIELGQCL